jgi:membrane-associated phospholipid phosphatase
MFDRRLSPLEAAVALVLALVCTRLLRAPLGHGLELHPGLERASAWTVRLGIWSWLLVAVLKLGWGRVRFRDLQPLQGDFTPWYAPQGWTGHSSFPSGHAALGWLLLTSVLIWPRGSSRYRWTLALCASWGVFVAASRVVVGAHYLSDVLFSTAFAFAVVGYAQRSSIAMEPQGSGAQRTGAGRDVFPVGK